MLFRASKSACVTSTSRRNDCGTSSIYARATNSQRGYQSIGCAPCSGPWARWPQGANQRVQSESLESEARAPLVCRRLSSGSSRRSRIQMACGDPVSAVQHVVSSATGSHANSASTPFCKASDTVVRGVGAAPDDGARAEDTGQSGSDTNNGSPSRVVSRLGVGWRVVWRCPEL